MTVQPIFATLAIVHLISLGDIASRFVPFAFLAMLWLAIKLSTYVRAPIALYRKDMPSFNVSARLVAPYEAIDYEVRRAVEHGEQALGAVGFQFPQRTTIAEDTPLSSIESLLEHPGNGDLADMDAMIYKRASPNPKFFTWVAYRSAFADGTVFNTANLDLVGYWPDQPGFENVTFPEISDPLEVYRLHRSRVARKAARVPQLHESRGSTAEQRLAFATRQSIEAKQWQVSCGYRKHTATGYRFTMRGATLSAWRRLFPWKQISAARARRAAAEVVRLS